jgi:H+/gluconate symporter-like permease
MNIIGVLGIILAIVMVIYLTVKGLNIILAAPLATLIVLVTNQMPLLQWMVGTESSYLVELANFIVSMFGLFLLGSILTQFMSKSGATDSISQKIIEWVGTKNPYRAMLAIVIIGAILTYGGINAFIIYFAILPIARSVFKELDINWSLITIPLFMGIATFTMTMLPGTPSPTNVVPVAALGTTLTTGPLLGIGASVGAIIFGLIYMRIRLNQSLKNGETFNSYKKNISVVDQAESLAEKEETQKEIPGFLLSITPLVTLILIIFIFKSVDQVIIVGLSVATVLSMILYRKYISESYIEVLNEGTNGSIAPAVSTASAVAFGSLMIYADGFDTIIHLIESVTSSPIALIIIIAAILGAVTGSTTGAVGIVMNTMGESLLASGLAPAVIHRVSVVATGLFVLMPHSGSYITFRNLSGLSIKDTHKDAFITVLGGHVSGLIVMLILSYLLY